MEDKDYSKRETDEMMKGVHHRFDDIGSTLDNIGKDVASLSDKVGIQNGRVSKLESKWIGVTMAGSVAIVLIGMIISLVVYSFKVSQDNLKSTILLEISSINK